LIFTFRENAQKEAEYQKLNQSQAALKSRMDEMDIENETLKEFLEKFQLEIETEKDDLKELTQQFFKLKDKYLGSKRLQTAEKIPHPLRKKKSKEKVQSMVQTFPANFTHTKVSTHCTALDGRTGCDRTKIHYLTCQTQKGNRGNPTLKTLFNLQRKLNKTKMTQKLEKHNFST
jgi:hypothetical protein